MESVESGNESPETGVDFADAATVLFDELASTIRDESLDEERYITIGVDALNRVLVVIYACDEKTIRLISARTATKRERKEYEEHP